MKINLWNQYAMLPAVLQFPILLWAIKRYQAKQTTKNYWFAYNLADWSQNELANMGLSYIAMINRRV